jgi:branched-subunit amino acid aminotransferase/4-amino-4-deoxychorismate lyase
LTSNLFVIRNDGKLQTSPDNLVLSGYARHLIIKQARRLGLSLVLEPPRLDDRGSWKGIFLTSSIRLLIPVHEVVVMREGNDAMPEIVWSSNTLHPLCDKLFAELCCSSQAE